MTITQDTPSPRRFGLSGNALKVIAIIAMTVDHLAWMGIEEYARRRRRRRSSSTVSGG